MEFIMNYNDPNTPLKEVLDLSFTMESEQWGEKIIDELKPGGSQISVTEANSKEYVKLFI